MEQKTSNEIAVDQMPDLADAIARYRLAYLMTTSDKGSPHVVPVDVMMEGGELVVDGIGRHTRENASARPVVGMVWPPQSESDYSLIVDGQAVVNGERLRITPTRAVLHRSDPAREPKPSGGCASDCVEVALGYGQTAR